MACTVVKKERHVGADAHIGPNGEMYRTAGRCASIGPYGGAEIMEFHLFIESALKISNISPFLSCPLRGTLPPGEGIVR